MRGVGLGWEEGRYARANKQFDIVLGSFSPTRRAACHLWLALRLTSSEMGIGGGEGVSAAATWMWIYDC
jgi:hypothetical protein